VDVLGEGQIPKLVAELRAALVSSPSVAMTRAIESHLKDEGWVALREAAEGITESPWTGDGIWEPPRIVKLKQALLRVRGEKEGE